MPTPAPRMHRPVLLAVLDALRQIFGDGAQAEQVVEEALKRQSKWGARDRRSFAASVYELVRWWRREAWRAGVDDALVFGPALSLETCATIWAGWWTSLGHELPDFPELQAVVPEPAGGRDRERAGPAVVASIPDWLEREGARALGNAWAGVRQALNEPSEVWLRANSLQSTTEQVTAALAREEIAVAPSAAPERHPWALQLTPRRSLATSIARRSGLFEVQDAGSQEIAPFLQPQPGDTIIDSCAGAGGKSLHLAAMMQNRGRVIAMDVHRWKLDALEARAARAGASCLSTRLIASADDLARHRHTADRLLIDAPCSGLGVLRRHPDTKWKLSPEEIDRLVRLQREILDSHTTMLKPGGTLVYATCSFLPQENQEQVRGFLARQPIGTWSLEEEKLLLPASGTPASNHDAFYMARLVRLPS